MPEEFSLDDETPATNESAAILAAMPEPQQHAIDAATKTPASSNDSFAEVDSIGDSWDPAIHATGADGKGVKTAKGQWRKRRGVALRPSTIGTTRTGSQAITPQGPSLAEQQLAAAHAAGAAAASSIFMLGRALGGEDWAPTADEVTMQTAAWGNYFAAKGIYDFPPGMALCIATLGYAGPRFFTPRTQERVGTIKHWFAIRVAKYRVKKALRKLGMDAVVAIKGSKSADVYDSILVNGEPFNTLGIKPDGTRAHSRNDTQR